MSASDESNPPVDKKFRDLLDAAGADAIEKAKSETLSLEKARDTLNSLLEEAGGAEAVSAQQLDVITTTQDAMESLFVETLNQSTANPDVLVGLDENEGIPGMGPQSDEVQPVIAGAERPDSQTQPVKRLDDGVDFWRELESDPDDSN